MKFEKLIIYGFGKHENVTVDFGPTMNVLYGANEAGKTTIQQFILHILFGFPQRNSAMLRYEPKLGGKYGGQIQLVDEVYGRCTVERVRGKSAGDVTVYFEDGKQGGVEALNQLLRQYDRTSFESIFSFSLLQLQGFEKMDEAELSRILLASGTTGVDSLLRLEIKMEKEMDELFKKSGRNPLLNVKIKELRTLEVALQEEQKKVAEYTPALERIHQIDEQLTMIKEQKDRHENRLKQLSLQRQLLPLHHKKEMLMRRLNQLGTINFPADGIRRFESFTGKVSEAEAARQRLEHELVEAERNYSATVVSERITEIDLLLARESEWHNWRSTYATLKQESLRLEEQKLHLFNRLGIMRQDGDSLLLTADVSLRKEEEMHELLGELNRLNNEIGFAESQFRTVQTELGQARENERLLVPPSDEELKAASEWPTARQRLAEAKAYVAYGGKQANQSPALPVVLLFAALIFVVFGVIQQQWFVAIVGFLMAGIGGFLYLKKESVHDPKLEEMKKFVAGYDGKDAEMEQLITRVESYTREKERLEAIIIDLQRKEHKQAAELEQFYHASRQTEVSVDAFIGNYGFDGLPSPGIIPELFRMIREAQKVSIAMDEITQQQKEIEGNIAERMVAAEKVLEQAVPEEAIYELLRREFIRLSEEVEQQKMLEKRITQVKPVLQETAMLVTSLQNNINTLFAEAGVESEEAFYKTYDIQQEKESITRQLTDLNLQLAMNDSVDAQDDQTDDDLLSEIAAVEKNLVALDAENNQFVNEKAALVNKAKQLLTDETYGEKVQVIEMKKAELNELAKKWSARKAVAEAIKQMMNELKEKQLPDVLLQAEKIFKKLTGGKYDKMTISEQGYFEATAINGLRFPIVELSQATKEQAYISLRFALATSVLTSAPFPIIMDDPFVHFDEGRLSSMIEVLNESKQHQFIYFTCDERMKDKWMDAKIINVSTIENVQGGEC